jgi:hypothetical protein
MASIIGAVTLTAGLRVGIATLDRRRARFCVPSRPATNRQGTTDANGNAGGQVKGGNTNDQTVPTIR